MMRACGRPSLRDHEYEESSSPRHFAACANGALFFPINPGQEEQFWERFYGEGIDRFFDQTYADGDQASLIEEFEKLLPEKPPWKNRC